MTQQLLCEGACNPTNAAVVQAIQQARVGKVDGKDVAALAKVGNWDAIRDHCLSDVGLTHAVAERLGLLR